MSKQEKQTKFITRDILKDALIGSVKKLNPAYMIKNPVMFVVEIGFFISLILTIFSNFIWRYWGCQSSEAL